MSEKSFVMAISRHFGPELAKQVIVANVSKVEEFAGILHAWDEVEEDREIIKTTNRLGHFADSRKSQENGSWGNRRDEGRYEDWKKNYKYPRNSNNGRMDWRSRDRNEDGSRKPISHDIGEPTNPENTLKGRSEVKRLN